jgi:hypothetical protein
MQDLKTFLQKIAQIESAGGKNTKHRTMKSGIHAGSSAYGMYGLMPNTIRELAKRQEMNDIASMSDEDIKQQFSQNPELENKFAEYLGGRLLNKYDGDEARAAYAWNMGHNLPKERITDEKLSSHPYVNKFNKLGGILNTANTEQKQPVRDVVPQAPISPNELELSDIDQEKINPIKFSDEKFKNRLKDITQSGDFQRFSRLFG